MMKIYLSFLVAVIFGINVTAQKWVKVNSLKPTQQGFQLVSSNEDEQVVKYNLNEYGLIDVNTPKGKQVVLAIKKGAKILKKGAPDLSKITQSIIINNTKDTRIEILNSKYIELKDISIAPSKGTLTRNIDPKNVPYEFGEEYSKNEFFPNKLAELSEAYNIREVRGQTIILYPYQYNPVTKVLRIYTEFTVKVKSTDKEGSNALNSLKASKGIDPDFQSIYSNHFLNYSSLKSKKLDETGKKMLIISYDDFANEMSDFINWKRSIGFQVELVKYSTIGSSSKLKTFVANYYKNKGLTYLILVGDHPQIPTSSTRAGDSDNNYGYIVGNDHYLDIFVGRFSAEQKSEVVTMGKRIIKYERDISSNAPFIKKGVGIASNESGAGGDNGENDEQHMNLIKKKLEKYNYKITNCYQNGGSASQLSSLINQGTGLINYVGHGDVTYWVAPRFTNNHINKLTNTDKYPFIISVACQVGNFKNNLCFSEAWIRASSGGTPTGAIAFCGSTINQLWNPPMRTQDVVTDLLVTNSYQKYGGLFVNGLFAMIDAYNENGESMADTWVCFGDPSVQTRTPGHPNGPTNDNTGACSTPSNLLAKDITKYSATMTWGSVSGARSYLLQYKAENASNWTEQSLNSTSFAISNLEVNTTYNFRVKALCQSSSSNFSMTESFTTGSSTQITYCESKSKNGSYEWIAKVKLNNFVNSSEGSTYSDYTSKVITFSQGESVKAEFTPGFSGSSYKENWALFIDYNKDGDFNDAGEKILHGGAQGTASGEFTIPSDVSGQTRLRVIMSYSETSACATYDYGETEDYTVNITNRNGRKERTNFVPYDISVSPNPNNGTFQLKVNGEEGLAKVSIYSTTGQLIHKKELVKQCGEYTYNFNLNLPSGVYIVKTEAGNKSKTLKMVIE